MVKKLRKIVLILWLVLIIGVGIYIQSHKEFLDPKFLKDFFVSIGSHIYKDPPPAPTPPPTPLPIENTSTKPVLIHKTSLETFGAGALGIYILISFIRGIVLLPSLPLVLVGTLIFPHSPFVVFGISMLGIIFSSILIYKFSDIMGFDELFAKHQKSKKIQESIEKYGFWTVLIWSFAPVVPTDLICYIAGTVRMNFWKFVLAISIGEGLCVALLIYGGTEAMKFFRI